MSQLVSVHPRPKPYATCSVKLSRECVPFLEMIFQIVLRPPALVAARFALKSIQHPTRQHPADQAMFCFELSALLYLFGRLCKILAAKHNLEHYRSRGRGDLYYARLRPVVLKGLLDAALLAPVLATIHFVLDHVQDPNALHRQNALISAAPASLLGILSALLTPSIGNIPSPVGRVNRLCNILLWTPCVPVTYCTLQYIDRPNRARQHRLLICFGFVVLLKVVSAICRATLLIQQTGVQEVLPERKSSIDDDNDLIMQQLILDPPPPNPRRSAYLLIVSDSLLQIGGWGAAGAAIYFASEDIREPKRHHQQICLLFCLTAGMLHLISHLLTYCCHSDR